MTTEQLLKRLPEVDPEHFQATECADEIAWDENYRVGYALWIEDGGVLQGGDALWFMIEQIQQRWAEFEAIADSWNRGPGRNFTKAEREEREVLRSALGISLGQLTPELILSTYVQWFQSSPERAGRQEDITPAAALHNEAREEGE